jgi:hypothetical protein
LIAVLARPAVARLVRAPRAWGFVLAWGLLALALGASARAQGLVHGADRVLLDAYGSIILPLLAFGLVGMLVGSGSLASAVAPLVSFGARPVLAAASTLLLAVVSTTALGALLASLLAIVSHGAGDPPLVQDTLASAWAGAAGGAAYACFFTLGSSLGRRGGGRALLLFLDWVFGVSTSAVSLFTPRAHLRNLLGGPGPLDFSGGTSAACLLLLAGAYAAVALARSRR